MDQTVINAAECLHHHFGDDALIEARRQLEAATAARDHRTAVVWAEICITLSLGLHPLNMSTRGR